jgi:hypothetical protein
VTHHWTEWRFDPDAQERYHLWIMEGRSCDNPHLWALGVKPHVITEDLVHRRDDGALICLVCQDTEYEP